MSTCNRMFTACFILAALIPLSPADTVSPETARTAAKGWLKSSQTHLGCRLAQTPGEIFTEYGDSRTAIFHVINLIPDGFIYMSADDRLEPVIAFSQNGSFMGFASNELASIIKNDISKRLWAWQLNESYLKTAGTGRNPGKWDFLLYAGSTEAEKYSLENVDDVRVPPLTLSKWGQSEESSNPCYNYYTPYNYPSGCVATCMAQYIRYHQYPVQGIGTLPFSIEVDGAAQTVTTMGGDGSGGPYNYDSMPLDPDTSTPEYQRQAIGALLFDAGATVEMSYTEAESSADTKKAVDRLKSVFGYADGVYGVNSDSVISGAAVDMINSNIDAGYPVIISISRPDAGHAVLADGYGYNLSTMYHHLNMGWRGIDDLWYALPDIDAQYYQYDTVQRICYNMFPDKQGEIISGRVHYAGGVPIEGAAVTLEFPDTSTLQTTTGVNGIYAFAGIPSNTSYTLSAYAQGFAFIQQTAATGNSQDYLGTTGNLWGVDFAATNPTPPVAQTQQVHVESIDTALIKLKALDDGLPSPPGAVSYIVNSLPANGRLFDINNNMITALPYQLPSYSDTLTYAPCPTFGGENSFEFSADDGGTAPSGGRSQPQTVTINVDNLNTHEYPHNNYYGNWPIWTENKHARVQTIYTSTDIGDAGDINAIAFDLRQIPVQDIDALTIRIKETSRDYYSGPPYFETAGWTVVYSGFTEAAQTEGWWRIDFQNSFYYNGTSNLLIDVSISQAAAAAATQSMLKQEADTRVVFSYTDSETNPVNWSDSAAAGLGGLKVANGVPAIQFFKRYPVEPLSGDFDDDCFVGINDYIFMADSWLASPGMERYNPECNLSTQNSGINNSDFSIFQTNWLTDSLE
ncbi:Streptopain precursor [Limihaloglobus sulfuriphilus]|uniref:Streptopain n=1 Tax=Limihaloglobus sulfuriphilus TaxID=1851148 RepID=A0A1Q2MBV4_9BACT|nr:C10 family peptidase [Limihaloglobus sulfuriphilus]AQQ69722.1 Streptopain precursor [Limihaloglobus sulfuriphilus]